MDANQHVNNVKYIGWILEVRTSQESNPLTELLIIFNANAIFLENM